MDMPENWTGVFRSRAETVGSPITKRQHRLGVTARHRASVLERIGTGLALAVFLGAVRAPKTFFDFFTPYREFLIG